MFVYCSLQRDCDLGEVGVAVLITYKNGETELLQRGPHQNIHNFLASALRLIILFYVHKYLSNTCIYLSIICFNTNVCVVEYASFIFIFCDIRSISRNAIKVESTITGP